MQHQLFAAALRKAPGDIFLRTDPDQVQSFAAIREHAVAFWTCSSLLNEELKRHFPQSYNEEIIRLAE
ncbi:hypothetical protein D3C78_1896290 [compost metagenome]